MNVEDSYEGAVRRLRRLGHAGIDRVPPPPRDDERVRDLEELASLACEQNERLESELATARGEIDRLRRLVGSLQETMAGTQADDGFSTRVPRSRGGVFWFFTIVILGGGAAAAIMLRPWERYLGRAAASVGLSAPAEVPSAPVVAPPPPVVAAPPPVVAAPAPVVAAPPPVVAAPAPVVPKVEPIVPKAEPVAAAPAPAKVKHHHASKHHAAKSRRHEEGRRASPARAAEQSEPSSDPLGGLGL